MARAENHTENYYLVLGISQSANTKEIKAAFRHLARQYHPDLNPDDSVAAEKFKLISQAYDVLSDSNKRRRYDRNIPHQQPQTARKEKAKQAKYADFKSAPKAPPTTALDFFNRGTLRIQTKEYRQAINDFSEAIKLNPRFVEAFLRRCEMRYKLGDNQGVLDDCFEVVKIDPTVAKAYYYQGRARYSLSYVQPAIESYTSAIAQDSNYAQAHYYRGIAYKESKNTASAVNDLTIAAELFRRETNYDAYRRTRKIVNELTQGKMISQQDGLAYNFIATLGVSFFNPGGGLLPAFSRLEDSQLKKVGTIYGLFSCLCFVASYFMSGISLDSPVWQLFLVGITPFISLVLTGFISRTFWHHRGNFSTDIFIAGVAIAPIALSAVLVGFVPLSAWSLIIPLAFLGCSYSVLTLQAGYVQLLNLTEAKAAAIVAVMLMINSYISYIFFSSLLV
jgi:curved DNA-binding protein CbpA